MWRFLSIGAAIVVAAPCLAAGWTISEEEAVILEYRKPTDKDASLSLSCNGTHSDIVAAPPPGFKAPATPPALVVASANGTRKISMPAGLCGGETTCTDRAKGDVSEYRIFARGKALVLGVATTARSLSFEAPGVSVKAPADAAVFATFVKKCKTWQ